MALFISIPDSADDEQIVTLNKKSYILETKFNKRGGSWSVSLRDSNGEPIILGEKVVPSQEFLEISAKNIEVGGYLGIKSLVDVPVTRDNFGIGKDHQLLFISQEEVDNAVST